VLAINGGHVDEMGLSMFGRSSHKKSGAIPDVVVVGSRLVVLGQKGVLGYLQNKIRTNFGTIFPFCVCTTHWTYE